MIKKIKNYIEYRNNKKIAKRELAKMAAGILPVIREVSDKGTYIVNFIIKMMNEAQNADGENAADAASDTEPDKAADDLKADTSL